MDAINNVLYNITDKIIELQVFFLAVANKIAYIMLFVAICTAAINYALTGTGLKENIIKIGKAFVFFTLVIFAYPSIVGWITDMTFTLAKESTTPGISSNLKISQKEMEELAEEKELDNEMWTYGTMALRKYDNFFRGMLSNRTFTNSQGKSYSYSTVAPAYAMKSMLNVAGECMRLGGNFDIFNAGVSISNIIKGYVCGFFLLIVGTFCVLEYLIAFVEFMFVSSVGVILFPLSLWDGTKFIAESFVKSMLGFFVKMLFCTICIFFMLYIFISLSKDYVKNPFTGNIEQMATLFFTTLLTFYICKSAPALAQGLLSGTPSLSGAGAIGMVASTVMAASRLSHLMGGHAGQGTGGIQAPSAQTSSAISSGTGIAALPPPRFDPQPAPSSSSAATSALPAQQPPLLVEARQSDLERSLAYTNRPNVEWTHLNQFQS